MLPQAFKVLPLVVKRVYPDGRPDELVRGVDLIGTPLTSFAKILATGDDFDVFNGVCGAESGWVPVSAVAPSLLVGEIEVEEFTLLFKSSREFFFAPVIEYGPLAEWKDIAGEGQEMQDVFWYIKEAIDAYFEGRPFQVTVIAGCLVGKKLNSGAAPAETYEVEMEVSETVEDQEEQSLDTDLPMPPHLIAAGSVRVDDADSLEVEELSTLDAEPIEPIDEDSIEEQELDAFIEGKKRPSHLDVDED